MSQLFVGIKGKTSLTVKEGQTAMSMKSGTLDVLATPAVIALAEECAWKSIQDYLPQGQTTVGIYIQMEHKAPTPLGMDVVCQTELIKTEGRKLTFSFTVYDSGDEIATGVHKRFIVNSAEFIKKASEKENGV